MVKKATKKKRGIITRQRKKIILLGSEGKNETERRYFNGFRQKLKQYVIIHSGGNNTDAMGVINNTIDAIDYEELDFNHGDLAYVLLDCDINKGEKNEKQFHIALNKAKKKGICPILSNPTFEIWYLLHFIYTTKIFNSNQALVNDLKKYLPTYTKNAEVFNVLFPMIDDALKNAKKLYEYKEKINPMKPISQRHPCTEVYQLVTILVNDIG